MWDEDFKQKKFELGRIIERDFSNLTIQEIERLKLESMTDEEREKELNRLKNQDRGRVVKTMSIDFFLNCDTMNLDEIETD